MAGAYETVRVFGLLDVLTPAEQTEAILVTAADEHGRCHAVSPGPVRAEIAIVAIVGGAGDAFSFPVATVISGSADGEMYEVGTDVHELWSIDAPTLESIRTALLADPISRQPGRGGRDDRDRARR